MTDECSWQKRVMIARMSLACLVVVQAARLHAGASPRKETVQAGRLHHGARTHTMLTPPQQDVLRAGLLTSGFPVLLHLPTGSGKTWLAEQAIAATLSQGRRAVYLSPLRALASELAERWRTQFT